MREVVKDIERLYQLVPMWYGKDFAFDIETTGLSAREDRLLGLALSFSETDLSEDEQYYVVLEHTLPKWDGETFVETFISSDEFSQAIRPLFHQDVVMVAHNAKFEMSFLSPLGISVEGRLFDTMLAAKLIDENGNHGLKKLAPLVGMSLDEYKDLGTYSGYKKVEILGVPLQAASQYAMDDAKATMLLYDRFKTKLVEEGVEGAFHEVWMPLLPVLHQMESRGIAMNMDNVLELKNEFVEIEARYNRKVSESGIEMILARYTLEEIPPTYLKAATEEHLDGIDEEIDGVSWTYDEGIHVPIITYDMIGRNKSYRPRVVHFNAASQVHLRELIFDHLGVRMNQEIKLTTNTSDGTVKMDKDNIATMLYYLADGAPPILRELLELRKADKFIGTYLNRYMSDADPEDEYAIHASFNLAGDVTKGGTKTGRLSSSSPNLQNQPSRGETGKKTRELFVARKGFKLVVADYSNLELRILAHYSEDDVLLRAFESNQDIHSLTAAGQNNVDYEDFMERYDSGDTWAKEKRMIGKISNFGLTYGMGAKKFQRFLLVQGGTEVSLEESQSLINTYNETYSGAMVWKKRVHKWVMRHGYVRSISGRKRRLPEAFSRDQWLQGSAQRQAANFIIQASAADIISKAMRPVQSTFASLGGSLLLQVHDELVGELPEEHADLGARLLSELMVGFANTQLKCPLVAEAGVGDNWYSAKG